MLETAVSALCENEICTLCARRGNFDPACEDVDLCRNLMFEGLYKSSL